MFFKNWLGPINNGKFHSQTFRDTSKTDKTHTRYTGSSKFNGIPREGNP